MQKKQASLRKKLLSWLVPLLLILIVIDSAILHDLAINKLGNELDADLYSSAAEMSNYLVTAGENASHLTLLENVSKALLSNESDKVIYSITDEHGLFISGNKQLAKKTQPQTMNIQPHFFFIDLDGTKYRIVSAAFKIATANGPRLFTIQIAATLNHRNQLANTILLGIVVPQLLLALLSFLIIWFGVKKGLAPLDALQDAVSKRSEQDLSPIELPNIPQEVSLVANAVNQLMQKLQNLISAQNRFIADAAHQLRTPLAGAQAQLELAELETDPATFKSMLPRAHQSLDKLLHTINQLLVLARSQPEAAASLEMVNVDLNVIVKEMALEMVPTAIKKGVDLGFEPSLVPAQIAGNVERLNDMLANLIDNAIRYTPAGGTVTVSLDVSETLVSLIVEDDGPGVNDLEKDKIFDRFHRVVGMEQEGSGLGLAIVKEIATLHAATISLADIKNKRGLRVMVNFKRI